MWYSTGSVAVTNGSATITGTGTAWLDAVQQGWAFYGPDGRPYQVLTVNSNTSITLARNYAGTTTTGAQYDIVPTQALVRTLAQRVGDLIATYSGFVTTRLAGLFSAGSASTPGVAREGDANTGMFWPADDVVALATTGVERVRIDASGNVGIGASSPATRLHVDRTTDGASLTLAASVATASQVIAGVGVVTAGRPFVGTNVGSNAMEVGTRAATPLILLTDSAERVRVDAIGVGIGGAATVNKLEVYHALNGIGARVRNTATSVELAIRTDATTAGIDAGNAADGMTFSLNTVERMRLTATGINLTGSTVRVQTQRTPASATATGAAGEWCHDASFFYACVATNTWKRAPLSTW